MQSMCAWCDHPLGSREGGAGEQHPITHGICRTCSEALWQESGGVPVLEFLQSLEIPTLLVDGDGRVDEVSPHVLSLLEKTQEEVANRLGGEVLDCVNAELPGGCGKTELCSACTVRNTITDTYRTGESHVRVPAALTVRGDGSSREMSFLLTTEKGGDRVLVQIEPA